MIRDPAALERLGEPCTIARAALAEGALLASIQGARLPICTRQEGRSAPIVAAPPATGYLQPALAVADTSSLARAIWSQLVLTPPMSPLEALDLAELLTMGLDADARALGRRSVQGLLKAIARAATTGATVHDAEFRTFQTFVTAGGPPITNAQACYYVELRAGVSAEARRVLRDDHRSGRAIPYCQAYEAIVGVRDSAQQVAFLGYPSIARIRAAKQGR